MINDINDVTVNIYVHISVQKYRNAAILAVTPRIWFKFLSEMHACQKYIGGTGETLHNMQSQGPAKKINTDSLRLEVCQFI